MTCRGGAVELVRKPSFNQPPVRSRVTASGGTPGHLYWALRPVVRALAMVLPTLVTLGPAFGALATTAAGAGDAVALDVRSS